MRVSKDAPVYFNRYGEGMMYSSFWKNRNTQWYVFFSKYKEKGEDGLGDRRGHHKAYEGMADS